jgi:hypothetical protein
MIPLQQAVPVAHFEGRCALSPMAVDERFPTVEHGIIVHERIAGIARLVVAGNLVGWLYRTRTGKYYAQALPAMSFLDQTAAGITNFEHGENAFVGPHARPASASGLAEVHAIPWRGIRVEGCTSGSTLP